MKYFPIKTAVLCLLVTPVLYVLTLSFGETWLNRDYTEKIQNIVIGDSKPLLEGAIRFEDQVALNIEKFRQSDWKIQKAGLDVKCFVISNSKKILYPVYLDVNNLEKESERVWDPQKIAENNYSILNEGFSLRVETRLDPGTFIANLLLIFYYGISFAVFLVFYRSGSFRAQKERELENKMISELKKGEEAYKKILVDLKKERQDLFESIKMLNTKYEEDTRKAKLNEEEMFDEIVSLEEQLQSFIRMKQNKESEITELKSKVKKYERRKSSKGKRQEFDFMDKRFSALYKNVKMKRKALTGFLNLNDDQQIKAEELILLLDREPEKAVIKRKVFSGKKHKTTCFEVLFAYNGRLYFKKSKNNIADIVVIGTKNTQQKDMEFLHNL